MVNQNNTSSEANVKLAVKLTLCDHFESLVCPHGLVSRSNVCGHCMVNTKMTEICNTLVQDIGGHITAHTGGAPCDSELNTTPFTLVTAG